MGKIVDSALIKRLRLTETPRDFWAEAEQIPEEEAFTMGLSGFNEHMKRISEGSVPPESMSGRNYANSASIVTDEAEQNDDGSNPKSS